MPTRSSISIGALLRDRLAHLVVDAERLDDLVADRVERVHRGQRVLEDHRHLLAAQLAHLLALGADEFLPVEPDLAGDPRALRVQAHDAQRRDRLARAGLADDAERAAALDIERQPVDGLDDAVVGREMDTQVAHRQELGRRRPAFGLHLDSSVAHEYLTLGSTTAYTISTTRLANTTKNAATMVTAEDLGQVVVLDRLVRVLPDARQVEHASRSVPRRRAAARSRDRRS